MRYFSTHCRVAVIGGGTAGLASSAQLSKTGTFKPSDISVFEPRNEHHYQPSYTMIGGGVLGHNSAAVKKKERSHVKKPMDSLYNTGVNLVKEKVETFDPENNKFTTNKGDYTYDYLVVAPGCKLRYDRIEGAQEALDDPDHPVVSIYREDYAYKTLKFRERMREGSALFYQPPMPIKCGGAPQKILYLSESRWRDLGRRNKINVQYYSALGVMFPPCPKYSKALEGVIKEAGIPAHLNHLLTAVDKNNKQAIFKNTSTDEEVAVDYDFLHISPPQSAMDFIANSPLAGKSGFMAVDKNTLQHKTYSNVFGVGDTVETPASKTAATAFSQVPVMIHNILNVENGKDPSAKYEGYGSCPLFTGKGKLMLAEFKYGGESHETFYSGQDTPAKVFYHMKKHAFPWVYWNIVPRGLWYGNKTVFKPRFV